MQSKHAYLITAHKNIKQLVELVKTLDCPQNDVFIHYDKRSNCIIPEIETNHSHVEFIERIPVVWGGESQIKATLRLMESSYSTGMYDYYHYHSGQDLPIKSIGKINRFFERNPGTNYIYAHPVRSDYLLSRVKYHYRYADVPGNDDLGSPLYYRELENISTQIADDVDRTREYEGAYYKGANWFDITDDACEYILDSKPLIEKIFFGCKCADEFFVQTILMNSVYRDSVSNQPIILSHWPEYSPHPKIITMEDYGQIMACNHLFARKFDETVDPDIVRKILSINGVHAECYTNNSDCKTVCNDTADHITEKECIESMTDNLSYHDDDGEMHFDITKVLEIVKRCSKDTIPPSNIEYMKRYAELGCPDAIICYGEYLQSCNPADFDIHPLITGSKNYSRITRKDVPQIFTILWKIGIEESKKTAIRMLDQYSIGKNESATQRNKRLLFERIADLDQEVAREIAIGL